MGELRVELDFKPFAHQRLAHQLRLAVRFLVLVWHRRAGKTVFAIVELWLGALTCTRERGRFGYITPLLRQAKTVAWDYLKHFARQVPGCVVNESELYVQLSNGNRVQLFGADNPDAFRGQYFDGVVLDEVADMKPMVWGEIIRPALTDRQGWALFIGTPKGVNLFSELYYRAVKAEDGWGANLQRAAETGVIPQAELEQARREMSPAQFAQEMECDFAAAVDDVLLRLDDVLTAQRRQLHESEFSFAAKVLGVDVARYGDDQSVVFPRQGLFAFSPKARRGLDTMSVAAMVAQQIQEFQPDATFVDTGGIGGGVYDRLVQLGFEPIAVDFGSAPDEKRFENKKAEIWWAMADWIKGGASLPDLPELASDLTSPRYTYANKRGRLQLESKDELRSRGLPSPDYADALATTFAMPVAKRSRLSASDRSAIGHDYHPLAPREQQRRNHG